MENDWTYDTDHRLNRERKISRERTREIDQNNEQMTMSDNQIEHLSRPRNTNGRRRE